MCKNQKIFLKRILTNPTLSVIIHRVLALWCSRLARQPVTLEVDGSSPFGVAKKEKLFKTEELFFFAIQRTDSNHLNARVLWTLARARLDGRDSII